MHPLRGLAHRLGRWYIDRLNRTEWEAQKFVRLNERPVEYRFVFEHMTALAPERVLDVGSGTSALPSLMRQTGATVWAIDNVRDYWRHGLENRHYHIVDDDITRARIRGPFDFITCISTLEHIERHDDAVRGMFALLRPGGHLALTHPYNERRHVPDVYRLAGAGYGQDLPYRCQVFSRAQVDAWLAANGASLVAQEFWRCFTGEFWTFGEPLVPPEPATSQGPHQLTCLLLRKDA